MNDNTAAINRQLNIKAPIGKVWKAITDPSQLSQWFGQAAEFELTIGAVGWFGWDDYGKFAIQIEAIDEPSHFAWRWMAEKEVSFKAEESTLVEWWLEVINPSETKLTLRESGFLTAQSRSDNEHGWTEELGHLEQHLKSS
ncbi:MAG: SRPBCC domain-containing protein [Marinicella sp.]